MSATNVALKKPRAKRVLIVAGVALIGLILGTALTAAGLTEFAIGARYTQSELDVEKRDSEKRGYERGDEAGYERGYSAGQSDGYDTGYDSGQKAGYSAGLIRGCNNVFDEIGENLIAIRYPWYKISVYGYYWNRSSIC
jgi:flagellar biosynthesis/type III secretory pathway protein FliH